MDVRASDADRQGVIARLERHTAAGRLSLDEFTSRVDQALAARTLGELHLITHDLPTDQATVARGGGDDSRLLMIAFATAIAALVILGVLLALTR